MKKLFTIMLLIYLGFHILIPLAYYSIFGFRYIYFYVPQEYMYKAAAYQIIAIVVSIIFINFFDRNNTYVSVQTKCPIQIYYLSIIINLITLLYVGNFQNLVGGKMNGTILGYASLLFSMDVLFIVYFFHNGKKDYTIFLVLSYIIIKLLYASRSATFLLIIYMLCCLAFDNLKLKKNLILSIGLMAVFAPLVFFIATAARGSDNSFHSITQLMDQIISRLSAPELGGLYLYQYDHHLLKSELFHEKYNIIHQIKLAINSFMPGDIFPGDVDPNQYIRAIFMESSEEYCVQNYNSLNMTLPIYLIVKYTPAYGLPICVALIFSAYKICSKFRNNIIFIVLAISGLYDLLYFFDWVMISRRVLSIVLTITVVNVISKFNQKYKIVFEGGN